MSTGTGYGCLVLTACFGSDPRFKTRPATLMRPQKNNCQCRVAFKQPAKGYQLKKYMELVRQLNRVFAWEITSGTTSMSRGTTKRLAMNNSPIPWVQPTTPDFLGRINQFMGGHWISPSIINFLVVSTKTARKHRENEGRHMKHPPDPPKHPNHPKKTLLTITEAPTIRCPTKNTLSKN